MNPVHRNFSAWELRCYSAAMDFCVIPARLLARADEFLFRRIGMGIFPRNWRVTERFGLGPSGEWTKKSGPKANVPTLWLHGASLGEAKGVWYLASKWIISGMLSPEEPMGDSQPMGEAQAGAFDRLGHTRIRRVVVTANTDAGLQFLEKACENFRKARNAGGHAAGLLVADGEIQAAMAPVDHASAVIPFLKEHSVVALCLYEAELWPGWLRTCRARGIPAFLVSAKLTRNAAVTYGRHARAVGEVLSCLASIQAQTPADAKRFRDLGSVKVSIGADFKIGHYLQTRLNGESSEIIQPNSGLPARNLLGHRQQAPALGPPAARERSAIAFATNPRPRLAFISLHRAELKILLPALPKLCVRFDLIVFPRHLREVLDFRKLLSGLGFGLHSQSPESAHLLVDSLGRVGDFLPFCSAAFVGGSFVPIGVHNFWEPLLAGVKTYFGPYYDQQEFLAERMLERGVAGVIRTPKDAEEMVPGDEGTASACEALVNDSRIGLEAAWVEFRETIFATFEAGRGVAVEPTGNGSSAS